MLSKNVNRSSICPFAYLKHYCLTHLFTSPGMRETILCTIFLPNIFTNMIYSVAHGTICHYWHGSTVFSLFAINSIKNPSCPSLEIKYPFTEIQQPSFRYFGFSLLQIFLNNLFNIFLYHRTQK